MTNNLTADGRIASDFTSDIRDLERVFDENDPELASEVDYLLDLAILLMSHPMRVETVDPPADSLLRRMAPSRRTLA